MTRIDLERRESELQRALSAAAPEDESRLLVELAELHWLLMATPPSSSSGGTASCAASSESMVGDESSQRM